MGAPKGFIPVNGFKKGQSGNPAGPKVDPEKKRVMNLAEHDYPQFYEVLKEKALVDKESWAMKLFHEHLPKRIRDPLDRFTIKQDVTTLDTQIDSLRKGLGEIEDHDIDSATTILKALSSTKMADTQMKAEEIQAMDNKTLLEKLDRVLEEVDKEKEC